jgi:hypothetical protein
MRAKPAFALLSTMLGDLEKVLFDEPAIHRRLHDMAAQISNDYSGSRPDCDRSLARELDVRG